MLVKCNQVDDAARSMVFEGACTSILTTNTSPTVGITQNTMHRAQDAFVLKANGVIGSQGSSTVACNNIWDLSSSPNFANSQTYTDATTGTNTNSKLFMSSSLIPIPANNKTNSLNPSDIYTLNTGLNTSTGTPGTCSPVPPAFAPVQGGGTSSTTSTTAYSNELKVMAQDAAVLPVYSDEAHWQRQQFVFNEVKNNSALGKNNTALQNFYNITITKAIGKFASVEDKITSGNYSQAKTINDGIVTANVLEQNQQTVNNLILKQLLNLNYIYTTADKNSLNNIALQCPVAGGNAVYQARNLLMGITNNVIEFTDNCDGKPGRSMEEIQEEMVDSATTEKAFKLYPNPNDGNMILEYSLSSQSTGMFVLYDITGRTVNKYKLMIGENNALKISENELSNGVYFYSVIIDNTVKTYSKIVIVK
ncbi:MAG: T9SS type A sorting domain-containing protein [Bacteroidetes bacterium]|nr:T9SS type A sorting domain-containing protein [Bacteroidota bacterium]